MCWSTGGATGMMWSEHKCDCPSCSHSVVNFTFPYSALQQDFGWAIQRLRSGDKVRRTGWEKTSFLQRIRESNTDNQTVGIVVYSPTNKDGKWYVPTQEDMIATDWETYVKKCGECGQRTS